MKKTERYEYLIFGNFICRYRFLGKEIGYSTVGDLYKKGSWVWDSYSMKLKMDEIDDYRTVDLLKLNTYCKNNKLNFSI